MAKTIVVYGATMAGVAAAAKAAKTPQRNHSPQLCPILWTTTATAAASAPWHGGGQNFFDIGWKDVLARTYYTNGSFKWWCGQMGQHYNVDAMSDLSEARSDKGRIRRQNQDSLRLRHHRYRLESSHITEVRLKRIFRDTDGTVKWDEKADTLTIAGDVFIDASESGRLTRMSNFWRYRRTI